MASPLQLWLTMKSPQLILDLASGGVDRGTVASDAAKTGLATGGAAGCPSPTRHASSTGSLALRVPGEQVE